MRIFDHPNLSNKKWRCPICQTRNDDKIVLIGINGTEAGKNIEAEQFHLKCLNKLRYYKDNNIVAVRF